MKCTKVVIPVAGFGTRRLPLTKSIEKCMIPVLNRPVIDYIVQDCIAGGITDFYFIVGDNYSQLKRYYEHNEVLEQYLKQNNKSEMLEDILPPKNIRFNYIVQEQGEGKPYGTSVPVWMARDLFDKDEKILVIMGDQFMFNADGSSETERFLNLAKESGTPSAMLAVEVPHEEVYKYGIVVTSERNGSEIYEKIIERPSVEEAPTNLNNASFYLFDKEFFSFLGEYMSEDRDGEYLVIDPLNRYVEAGNEVTVIRNKGEYLDCGTVDSWVRANQRVLESC